jgi:hypothetical protein
LGEVLIFLVRPVFAGSGTGLQAGLDVALVSDDRTERSKHGTVRDDGVELPAG